MHARILLLAVLATFPPIIQVASTKESRFSTEISIRLPASPSVSGTKINSVTDIVSFSTDQQTQIDHQYHKRYQRHHQRIIPSAQALTEEKPIKYQLDNQSQNSVVDDKVAAPIKLDPSILSTIFNMERPPKIDRSKTVMPGIMKQLYKLKEDHNFDSVHIPNRNDIHTKSANTVRCFMHKDSKIDDRFPHHHRFRLNFDIQSIPVEEKLKAAELQLSRDAISHAALNPREANRTRYQVLVYDITRLGVLGKREPNFLLLDNKTIRLNSTDTVSLDVQPAVNRWLDSPKNNFGLLVEIRTMRSLKPAPHHHVRLRRSVDEPGENWQHKQPLLMTYTDDGRQKARPIRDINTRLKQDRRRRKKTNENCRRHDLYVDFSDVGWSDWIVAPNGYDAFYCQGTCKFPLPEHYNSTNHAVMLSLVNYINPGLIPEPCCVPTKLEGIAMLYHNAQNEVVLKIWQDMTAVNCGCR